MPAFEKSQIVKVPYLGAEGRISGVLDFVDQEMCYQLKWLDEAMAVQLGVFKEHEVVEAQKPKPDSTLTMKVEVDDTGMKKATDAANELRAAADAAAASLDRLPPNVLDLALAKRKPRAASKRKSKR